MDRKSLAVLAVAGLVPTFAAAQFSQSNLGVGISVGYYFPSSPRVRNAFGDNLLNYGIGGTGTSRPSNGSFTPDLSLLYGNSDGNKLFIGTFTYGYEYNLEKPNKPLVPYIRPFVGLTYFDFGITEDSGRTSLKRVGYTYGGEVGIVLNRRIRVAARYNVYSSEDSFSFNGFTVLLSYSFF